MKLLNITEDDLLTHMDNVELIDFEIIDNDCIVFTKPNELFNIKKYFDSNNFEVQDEEIIMDPLTIIDINKDDETKIINLSSKIEEIDDVQNVYMNINLS